LTGKEQAVVSITQHPENQTKGFGVTSRHFSQRFWVMSAAVFEPMATDGPGVCTMYRWVSPPLLTVSPFSLPGGLDNIH
jgi:hypothetical protein